jgi:hypothetical protein
LKKLKHLILLGHVSTNCDSVFPSLSDIINDLLRLVLAAIEIHSDRVSALCRQSGDSCSNPTAGAGDDNYSGLWTVRWNGIDPERARKTRVRKRLVSLGVEDHRFNDPPL